MNVVIEIEGQVASGKTSICKELTNQIKNCILIDGGAIYRGIILAIKKAGYDLSNMINVDANINPFELMKKLQVEFKIENKQTVIYIAGQKMNDDDITNIQNDIGVSSMWSKVDNEPLYKFARNIIEEYRKNFNVIVSGRDLIKIYPDRTCHIFVTAELEERVNRRYNQYDGKYQKDEIRDILIQRDKLHELADINNKDSKNISVDVTECKTEIESTNKVVNELINNNFISTEMLI